jgi:hypothetical protein
MKPFWKDPVISLLALVSALGIAVTLHSGCTSAVSTVTAVNTAIVASVDQAMTGWSEYVNARASSLPTNATLNAEILSVSNAYMAYYNAELVLSNLSAAYVAAPTNTTLASGITIAATGLGASKTNILNLITQFSQ